MKTLIRSRHGIALLFLAVCIALVSGCLQGKGGANSRAIKESEYVEGEINADKWFEAVRWGSMEDVQELLGQGADPDAVFDNGESALHMAVEQGNTELAELLLAYGADVNVQERRDGYTALMYAAITADRKMIQLLIDHGADPTVADIEGYTVYHYLAYLGNSAAMRLIAGGAPTPTELPAKDGLTVADVASLSHNTTRMIMASAANHGKEAQP